jgi:hypothetical protein
VYATHDNGGRPFVVYVDRRAASVFVYRIPDDYYVPAPVYEMYELYTQRVFKAPFRRVWVGKSARNSVTRVGGGYGKAFDGNTVLVEEATDADPGAGTDVKRSYVLIGASVHRFTTSTPIVTYVSNVGNNDVPYPYAVDSDGATYLFEAGTKVKKVPRKFARDPYGYFFSVDLLTPDMALASWWWPWTVRTPDRRYRFDAFWVGDEQYTMRWTPRPYRKFRRLSADGTLVALEAGKCVTLTRKKYVDIMHAYAREMGFETLSMRTVYARRRRRRRRDP